MKFVISSTSPTMVNLPRFMWDFHEITEKQFQHEIEDAISHVGHSDIANKINVAYNKTPVHARPGDELYYANMERGELKYYRINVLQSINDLIQREYGEI